MSSGTSPSSGAIFPRSPTSTIVPSRSRCASSAPATISPGAWSPPIASTAMTGVRSALLNPDPVLDARLTTEVVFHLGLREALAQRVGVALRVALLLRAAVVKGDERGVV